MSQSQSPRSQPLLSLEDLEDTSANTPSPPPQPGEQGRTRRSHTAPRMTTGGRATRSSTRAGGTDLLATPITPSRKIMAHVRSTAKALDGVTTNSYSLLGDDEVTDVATTARGQQMMAHGWDAFIISLHTNEKEELGAINEILVSYANFAGGAFRTFEAESDRVMNRILAIEEEWKHDRDEMVQKFRLVGPSRSSKKLSSRMHREYATYGL